MATTDSKAVQPQRLKVKLPASPATLKHVGHQVTCIAGLLYAIKRVASMSDTVGRADQPYCILSMEIIAEKAGYLADRLLSELGEIGMTGNYDQWTAVGSTDEGSAS